MHIDLVFDVHMYMYMYTIIITAGQSRPRKVRSSEGSWMEEEGKRWSWLRSLAMLSIVSSLSSHTSDL